MSPSRSFHLVYRLGSATVTLMFALIVVGSIVRTTGSGLACPDWPLCHGQLIPPLQFNILVEWFHRLLALLVSVLLAAIVGLIAFRAELRARLGGLAALSVALLLTQVLLGALTVWKLLDPSVVSGHLAVALLLFGSMLTLVLVARHEAGEAAPVSPGARAGALLPLFGTTAALVFLQAVLGGMVSTHHASLACPDWPTCNGEWFPPLEGLVGLQMAHRYAAYALTALVVLVAVRSRGAGDARVWGAALVLATLTIVQVALGVTNVMLGIPVWVSALHLGNAAAMLALALATTFRLAVLPGAEARSVAPATSGGAAS